MTRGAGVLSGLLAAAALLTTPALAQEAILEEAAKAPVVLAAPTANETDALVENVYGRQKLTLSGPWAYTIDPFDVPTRKPRGRRNFWEDRTELPDGSLIEYAWDSMPTMDLPGDWNSRDVELTHYEGVAWFRRTFDAPADGARQVLYFEAVNYHARVWLNGELLGEHEGGFTPFAFEVTGKLKPQDNSLVVRVDNQHGSETLPALDFDWKNYGGITRPVHLVSLPQTYVRDYWVRLEDGHIVADVRLDGPNPPARAEVAIPGLRTTISVPLGPDGRGQARVRAPRSLSLWSPQAPTLYDVEVRAGADSVADRIGFRTIETRGRELLLNGKPLWLRGISIHEEAIGATGSRTLSWGDARALLGEAQALGANFVRLAHYPHTERMTRLADEMGLLVWSEIPVYWEDVAYDSPETLALGRAMQAANIHRDLNRASIIVWSVANETPVEPDRLAFLQTLVADVRAMDRTRLVSAALNKSTVIGGPPGEPKQVIIDDPLGHDLDLIGVNQYEAWYGPRTPDQIAEVSFTNTFDKPMVFSEFGADIRVGYWDPEVAYFTENYGAEVYRRTLEMVDRTDGVVGISPWILKDFQSPRRWHPAQELWNRKGLISETGERKEVFDILRAYYADRAKAPPAP